MRRRLLAAFLLVAAPLALSSSLADPNAIGASGPEFQVSAFFGPRYSYGYRFGPAADMANSGDFLVVWASSAAGSLGEMAARAFDAYGAPRAGDFSIGVGNLFRYFPESPDVSAGDGQFVATFTSYDGTFGTAYQVKGQRFSLLGEPQGPRLDVSPYGYNSEVAAEHGDDFIVVWDAATPRVFRRRFDGSGAPSWPEQWHLVPGAIGHPDPDVALHAQGDFTVVWSQFELSGSKGIQGRRFDSQGASVGGTFQVSEFPSGSQMWPAVAPLPGGGFVAVWTSLGQDGSFRGVFGRIFDSNALPLGGEFQVNTTTAGWQQQADVSADNRGNFLVAWESSSTIHHGDLVRARWFDRLGRPLGDEFQVNQDFSSGQQLPAVAMRDDGESLVVWFSTQSPGGGSSVRARRFCAIPGVSPPVDSIVCAGSSATLSAIATGRQPFSYQWMKDGTPLQDGGRISGATSPTLVISGAQASDADSYACQVTDACPESQSTVSSAAQLDIEPSPSEVFDLTLRTEDDGATLRFTWGAAGGASDYVVRSDAAPNGGFGAVLGYAADPATGLSTPMTAGTEFFLVAARNPACGEGPLR